MLFLPLFFKLVIVIEVVLYLMLGASLLVSKHLLVKKEKFKDFIRGTTSTTPQAITTNPTTTLPTPTTEIVTTPTTTTNIVTTPTTTDIITTPTTTTDMVTTPTTTTEIVTTPTTTTDMVTTPTTTTEIVTTPTTTTEMVTTPTTTTNMVTTPTTEMTTTTPASDTVTCTNSCGVCVDVTFAGGTIQSRNFPGDYDGLRGEFGRLDCLFTIDVLTGKKIELTFTSFIVERCCDIVTVYDGTLTDGILLPPTTGYTIPSSIITTSNKMTINFRTDGDNSLVPIELRPGKWQATFIVV